jgi:hypothetical protein
MVVRMPTPDRPMHRKPLPIGIQNFREMREGGYDYVGVEFSSERRRLVGFDIESFT